MRDAERLNCPLSSTAAMSLQQPAWKEESPCPCLTGSIRKRCSPAENHNYGIQSAEETAYFKNYLAKTKAYGLSVCLPEYAADLNLSKTIGHYCLRNGFPWYNAEGMELQ
jgi:hypothetical protein